MHSLIILLIIGFGLVVLGWDWFYLLIYDLMSANNEYVILTLLDPVLLMKGDMRMT